jgi:hypothetical protein
MTRGLNDNDNERKKRRQIKAKKTANKFKKDGGKTDLDC